MKRKLLQLCCLSLALTACKEETPKPLPRADEQVYRVGDFSAKIINNDPAFGDALKKKFGETFITVYPKLVQRFNPVAVKNLIFEVERNFTYQGAVAVALSGQAKIIYKSDHFTGNNAKDIDVVTHEVMHVVQNYPGNSGTPGWVVEGLADYARYVYGVDLAEWKARIDHAPTANENYTDAYGVTARFFVWIERKVKAGFPEALDKACREGAYANGAIFTTLTGKTAAQLWAEYKASPAL
ncbi:basic secretory protein-like protein [Pedobacter sp. SYP-B3415]|uniref:basic secretory protein-like protein n=1 Tax=Pedobacter sp. SYP-B3415 TaxID=2496641 RepID=UPI00101DAA29|nr:basic secretory protein-like protein [Pedobacter sp. SYP-B3415]